MSLEIPNDAIEHPELIIDREIKLPRPLDLNIASVVVNTRANYLNDGYDLELTASFCKEAVNLLADGFAVEVEMSVQKAVIELRFVNSDYKLIGHPNDTDEEWKHSERKFIEIKNDQSGRL